MSKQTTGKDEPAQAKEVAQGAEALERFNAQFRPDIMRKLRFITVDHETNISAMLNKLIEEMPKPSAQAVVKAQGKLETKIGRTPVAHPSKQNIGKAVRFNAYLKPRNLRKIKILGADQGISPSMVLNNLVEAQPDPDLGDLI